jgi:hypothetical protein
VPLRLSRAAKRLRRGQALRLRLTTTFQPVGGQAVRRISSLRLRRRR